jgi:membrane-associated phospholipid phosphatase
MCFSAVYLDHHWIIDVVVGSAYALVVFGALAALVRVGWRGMPARSVP